MAESVEIITLPDTAWAEFRELRLHALRAEPQAFAQPYADALAQPDGLWRQRLREAADGTSWLVFARMGDRLVGMAGAFRSEEDSPRRGATVFGVYVDAGRRRQGVARRLLVALLERVAASGDVSCVRLTVNDRQTAAVRLYEELGFRVVGAKAATLGDGRQHRELVMRKNLG